jgi:energy-coupling factor transporter ATP-binding protein EcfA2
VLSELHAWIADQPLWRQQAFRYLLAQPRLEDEQRAEVRDLLLAHHGYAKAKKRLVPQPIKKEELAPSPDTVPVNRLHRLFALTDVNALPPDTELRFDTEGLTIVYGKNGAGKSSYVRSLKRLCRSVDRDQSILPNVLKQGAQGGKPRAHIEWLAAGGGEITGKEFDLSDYSLRTPIESISVFDSRCAQIYVDEENQIAFVPSVIRVLVRLAEEQMTIQGEVEELVATAEGRKPDFTAVATGSKARSAVEGLTAKSEPADLATLSTLDDAETARRKQLELALAAAASGESERQKAQLQSQARLARDLIDRFKSAAAMLEPEAVAALRGAFVEVASRREVALVAAEEAFSGEELAGVGSDPWKELWESARRFYGHAHAAHEGVVTAAFPNTSEGADCPLCFQELDQAARSRFQRFEAFVKSDAEARAAESERALRATLDRFPEQTLSACLTPFLDSLAETDAKLYGKLDKWLTDAGELRQSLVAASTPWPEKPLPAPPSDELETFAESRDEDANAVTLAVKPGEKTALQSELSELKAREALAERLGDAKAWITELGNIAALEGAKAALRTQGISIKQKALTEQVVTAALKDQLRNELDNFGFTHVSFELKPRGVHGTTMVQLRLRDAPERELADILSEGEKRALALAFFLAEVATAESPCGIVLDDPVASLDQERRQVIARRIATESGKRQVILFTHDIAFLFHVQVEAELLGRMPKMQQVWRVGDSVGRTAADAPFEASRVKERVGWLGKTLQEMPKESEFKTSDEHRMHVASWYDHLRRSWERAVEEIVFQETVQRFVPQVQTQRLKKVTITQEMLDELEQGMTNCSNWVHDQPVAEGGALPSRVQMRTDLDAFDAFCKNYRAK